MSLIDIKWLVAYATPTSPYSTIIKELFNVEQHFKHKLLFQSKKDASAPSTLLPQHPIQPTYFGYRNTLISTNNSKRRLYQTQTGSPPNHQSFQNKEIYPLYIFLLILSSKPSTNCQPNRVLQNINHLSKVRSISKHFKSDLRAGLIPRIN